MSFLLTYTKEGRTKELTQLKELLQEDILLEISPFLGYFPKGLATDSTGVKAETGNYVIPSFIANCREAYFEASLLQLTGGTVAIELYDATSGAVIASITLSATSYRSRTSNIIGSLIAGHEVRARFNVTTAGAAGSVGGDCDLRLIFKF
ncbi:hypothetical protein [Candidatus Methanodesulfokora washburnensis]|uniref:Uncharacterized protein n=1 Tax=Candidatus Methanodesulfokora washburnensis TaxID=2478471 RepID=A0A3R9PCZ3_9CREN|nr:hypothetical protein [Candidatus Methanodesulfokores washburnensis]RSN72957.1 hypothetical protein D6D85_11745 [Candidatus Methanodesulfokores washburnensis]